MRVPSTEVQNNFGKYLKYAELQEEIIVTKNGKDVARILPYKDPGRDGVREERQEYMARGDKLTYEEFLLLSETSGQRLEMIDGIVHHLPAPAFQHQYAVHALHGTFYHWFKGKDCIPLPSPYTVTFDQDPDNVCVVQPDLLVIFDKENIDHKGAYRGVPALIVEVLSAATRSKDMLKKLDLYKRCGVKEYWIVDPANEQIWIYALKDNDIINSKAFSNYGDDKARSFHFEGLEIAVKDVFA